MRKRPAMLPSWSGFVLFFVLFFQTGALGSKIIKTHLINQVVYHTHTHTHRADLENRGMTTQEIF